MLREKLAHALNEARDMKVELDRSNDNAKKLEWALMQVQRKDIASGMDTLKQENDLLLR